MSPMSVPATSTPPAGTSRGSSHAHLVAEFTQVDPLLRRDADRLSGILVAAVGAAGLHALGPAMVRTDGSGGVGVALLLEGGHAALHTVPETDVILVDLLARISTDLEPAYRVLSRRLAHGPVHAEQLLRG
jgi:S-adenosylmethionine/arginine decarboxylase-like enzyme